MSSFYGGYDYGGFRDLTRYDPVLASERARLLECERERLLLSQREFGYRNYGVGCDRGCNNGYIFAEPSPSCCNRAIRRIEVSSNSYSNGFTAPIKKIPKTVILATTTTYSSGGTIEGPLGPLTWTDAFPVPEPEVPCPVSFFSNISPSSLSVLTLSSATIKRVEDCLVQISITLTSGTTLIAIGTGETVNIILVLGYM